MHESFFVVVKRRDVEPASPALYSSPPPELLSFPSLRFHLISFLPFYLLPFFFPFFSSIRRHVARRRVLSLHFVFHESTWLSFPVTFFPPFLSRASPFTRALAHSIRSPPLKIISRADGTRKWNCTAAPEYVGCFTYDKIRDLFRVVGNYMKIYFCSMMIFLSAVIVTSSCNTFESSVPV